MTLPQRSGLVSRGHKVTVGKTTLSIGITSTFEFIGFSYQPESLNCMCKTFEKHIWNNRKRRRPALLAFQHPSLDFKSILCMDFKSLLCMDFKILPCLDFKSFFAWILASFFGFQKSSLHGFQKSSLLGFQILLCLDFSILLWISKSFFAWISKVFLLLIKFKFGQ